MEHNRKRNPRLKRGKKARRAAGVPAPAGMDKMWLEKARQIVDQTSEIRPEKVAAIQQALEEGRYEIDSRKLANILIAEWLLER